MTGFVLGAVAVVAAQAVWRLINWRRYLGWRVSMTRRSCIGCPDYVEVAVYLPYRLEVTSQRVGEVAIDAEGYAAALDEVLVAARVRAAVLNAAEGRARRKLPA